MNFIGELYLGETAGIKHDPGLIKEKLKNGEGIENLYLICVCRGDNLFEIIHSTEISKDAVKSKNYTVAGLANGKDEAFLLVEKIISDYINKFPDRDFSILKQRIV